MLSAPKTAVPRTARSARRYSTTVRGNERLNQLLGRRTVVVRALDGITSPTDTLAIVRAVERRFGRVAECRFHRDAEVGNRYQFVAYMSFWDLDAYDRVPKTNTRLFVKVPAVSGPASGGPGLADLAPFLEAKDWAGDDLAKDQDTQTDTGSRTIQFNVNHSDAVFQTNKVPPPSYAERFRVTLASNFVRWGGFAPMAALPEAVKPTRNDRFREDSPIDHPHMRHQLQMWAQRERRHTVDLGQAAANESAVTAAPAGDEPPEAAEHDHASESSEDTPRTTAPISESESSSDATTSPLAASTSAPGSSPELGAGQPQAEIIPTKAAPEHTPLKTARMEPLDTSIKHNYDADRRTQARNARGVMRKVEPASNPNPVSGTANKMRGKAPASQRQPTHPAASAKRKPPREKNKSAGAASPPVAPAPERPIEVEERTTGVASRLQKMMGGWL